MKIITQIINNLKKNVEENIKNYKLDNVITANAVFTFDNYIKTVE